MEIKFYMTKSHHYCKKCKGINGVYVKICEDTGVVIETYKQQLIRQTKDLIGKPVKHRPGLDEH